MASTYEATYQRVARQRLQAVLPFGWELVEFRARQLGGGGRVVATVVWPGDHEMTLDLAVTAGGVEAAMAEAIDAFKRLATQTV
jgi:hypothetical protein